jgi:hypothetical protein
MTVLIMQPLAVLSFSIRACHLIASQLMRAKTRSTTTSCLKAGSWFGKASRHVWRYDLHCESGTREKNACCELDMLKQWFRIGLSTCSIFKSAAYNVTIFGHLIVDVGELQHDIRVYGSSHRYVPHVTSEWLFCVRIRTIHDVALQVRIVLLQTKQAFQVL